MIGGRAVEATRLEHHEGADWAGGWPGCLEPLGERLRSWVAELELGGLPASVLYSGPETVVAVFTCPATAGAEAGQRAAALALADAARFGLDANPSQFSTLTTDAPGGAGGDEAAQPAQMHTLAVADTEATTRAMTEWLREAGLSPERIIPAMAPAVRAAVEAALERSSAARPIVALYSGEHGSVLAAAGGGRLRFVRVIGLGVELLAAALSREILPREAGGFPTVLDRASARALLYRAGVPRRGQVADAVTGLHADAILPLLQPVLQRCVVEIKQSLRFGLSEGERGSAELVTLGPGAVVPRLTELIGELCGLKVAASERATPEGDVLSSRSGLIAEAVAGRAEGVGLLPVAVQKERAANRLRTALWIGTAAAATLVGLDATLVRLELGQEREVLAQLEERVAAAGPAAEASAQLAAARVGLVGAERRIEERLAQSVEWDALLAVLAERTPPAVRLAEVELAYESGRPVCRLRGRAQMTNGEDPSRAVKSYLDALAAARIVSACRLGATQRAEMDGSIVQSFDMTLSLVGLPGGATARPAVLTSVVPGEEEEAR